MTEHFPVARCAAKSAGKSLSALSIGGPGIAMRLQKPFPLLKARILPNCSRIGWPPCPCCTFFSNDVSVLVSIRQAGHCPQDSTVKNSEIFNTSSTIQVPSPIKRTTPQPSPDPASRIELWSNLVSILSAGRKAEDGAAGMIAFTFLPLLIPPPHSSIRYRNGVPKGSS